MPLVYDGILAFGFSINFVALAGNSTNYSRPGGAYSYRTGGTSSHHTAWEPQGSYSDFHYSTPRAPRSVDPIAAWYRLRSRVSSLDFILLGSVAAAVLGGAVLLDALLSGAWRSSNAGVWGDVRFSLFIERLIIRYHNERPFTGLR